MASASLIVSCCLGNQSLIIDSDFLPFQMEEEEKVVSVVSLIFAAVSSFGILLLLCQSRCRNHQTNTTVKPNHQLFGPGLHHVMNCCVVSGLLANIGVIVRSIVWLFGCYPKPLDLVFTDFRHVFCLVSSVWIVYFYLSVIFWHLVYGLEMVMVSQRQNSGRLVQYGLGWVLPACLCTLGTWVAYTPQPQCGDDHRLDIGLLYAIVLLPVFVVFILLLYLFHKSSNKVKRSIIQRCGQFTAIERELMDNLHIKFILILITFFVCWIPNLLNGLFVNTVDDRSGQLVIIFYVLEAVLNPFQVVIDALILNGFPAIFWCCLPNRHRHGNQHEGINNYHRYGALDETDSILSFSNQRL